MSIFSRSMALAAIFSFSSCGSFQSIEVFNSVHVFLIGVTENWTVSTIEDLLCARMSKKYVITEFESRVGSRGYYNFIFDIIFRDLLETFGQ